MGKDALSAHPVQKYWKERKQKEKKRKAKSIHKQSKRPSIDSLEEEIASLVQKKNEGVLLNAERDRLRYLVQLHDNILEKQSKNFRNVDKLQSSQDPLDPEYGEDSRTETRKRLLGVQAFQRILEKSKVSDETIANQTSVEQPEQPIQPLPFEPNNSKTTHLVPLQVSQPTIRTTRDTVLKATAKVDTPQVEQELNNFYAELQDVLDTST